MAFIIVVFAISDYSLYTGWIFLLLGIIQFVDLYKNMYLKYKRIRKNGIETTEIVTGYTGTLNMYYPIIKYQTMDNSWVTAEYRHGFNFKTYKPGNKVLIRYNPDRLQDIIIVSDFLRSITPWITLIFSLSVITAGIYIIIKQGG